MAGHSKFKNIMHRKGAQDAKKAKIFNRIAREITVAAKLGGPDPASNPRLRGAIANAKSESMPKDRITRAIDVATGGGDDADYQEVRYEGYGPGGIAVIVEALSDNRNRTAANVRACFSKNGGSLGETGSVAFSFERVGQILYPADIGSAEDVFEAAVEAGAQNVESSEEEHEIHTAMEDFAAVLEALTAKYGDPQKSGLAWIPNNTLTPDADQTATLLKLIDALEDDDDVQSVHSNADFDEAVLEQLAG